MGAGNQPYRYLSVTLGRPNAIQDGDVTVPLSTIVGDQVEAEIGAREAKLWVGVVSHVR